MNNQNSVAATSWYEAFAENRKETEYRNDSDWYMKNIYNQEAKINKEKYENHLNKNL